ncbi:MAG: ArsR/SmtB family transcription factor [Sporichthyaceae bacterium]
MTNRTDWTQDSAAVRALAGLADGRTLPASVLTAETGLGPRTLAAALEKLTAAGVVVPVECGRWTYHRLAEHAPREVLAGLEPIASLRPGTAQHAVRTARRCWGHPAGRLGVALTDALRERGVVQGHDGNLDLDAWPRARMSGGVADDATYRLTAQGTDFLAGLGFPLPVAPTTAPCIDWTEQRHHLAGELGRCLLTGLRANGWVVDSATPRALEVTDVGRVELKRRLGVET